MIIRTISLLPKTTLDLAEDTLFEVSIKRDSQYISKATTYEMLQKQLNSTIDDLIAAKYGMSSSGNPINIAEIKKKVDDIKDGLILFSGKKTFADDVMLSSITYQQNGNYEDDHRAVDAAFVSNAMSNLPSFIGSGSAYTAGVSTDGIVYNGNSILKFIFANDSRTSNVITCPKTGNMTIYGWLADNGNVDTAAAWVALEGYVGGANPVWMILQLQPWIMGEKHTNLQYVGFNIPVTKDLQLRITSGFDLNYSNSTYQNRKNSLVKNIDIQGSNMPNAFLGYVIS